MIITRWQAPMTPNAQQIKLMLEGEGLESFEESYLPNTKINIHRHPFTEVRIVVEGEIHFNISGNQFVLRPGDRVEIPANTKHSTVCQGNIPCLCICAHRAV